MEHLTEALTGMAGLGLLFALAAWLPLEGEGDSCGGGCVGCTGGQGGCPVDGLHAVGPAKPDSLRDELPEPPLPGSPPGKR